MTKTHTTIDSTLRRLAWLALLGWALLLAGDQPARADACTPCDEAYACGTRLVRAWVQCLDAKRTARGRPEVSAAMHCDDQLLSELPRCAAADPEACLACRASNLPHATRLRLDPRFNLAGNPLHLMVLEAAHMQDLRELDERRWGNATTDALIGDDPDADAAEDW